MEHAGRYASKEADMETRPGSKTDERGTGGAMPPDAPVETPEADPRTVGAPDPVATSPELDQPESRERGDEADEREDERSRMVRERTSRSPLRSMQTKSSTSVKRSSPIPIP